MQTISSPKLRVRGCGSISEDAATLVAALVDYHDKKHSKAERQLIAREIGKVLDLPPPRALNTARRISSILHAAEIDPLAEVIQRRAAS